MLWVLWFKFGTVNTTSCGVTLHVHYGKLDESENYELASANISCLPKEKSIGKCLVWVTYMWPAKFRETKFRETFREIFISHFAKFLNYFREISRNFAKLNLRKFREISRKWFFKTVQKRSLFTFYSLILKEIWVLIQCFIIFYTRYAVNNFFRHPFKGTVSQDFLLLFFIKQLF